MARAAALARKLDTFSTKLFQEAIRLEALTERSEALQEVCEEIEPDRCKAADASQMLRDVAKKLADANSQLAEMVSQLQELAWAIQEAQDDLEQLESAG